MSFGTSNFRLLGEVSGLSCLMAFGHLSSAHSLDVL